MKQQDSKQAETVQSGAQVLIRLAMFMGVIIAIVIVFKMIAG